MNISIEPDSENLRDTYERAVKIYPFPNELMSFYSEKDALWFGLLCIEHVFSIRPPKSYDALKRNQLGIFVIGAFAVINGIEDIKPIKYFAHEYGCPEEDIRQVLALTALHGNRMVPIENGFTVAHYKRNFRQIGGEVWCEFDLLNELRKMGELTEWDWPSYDVDALTLFKQYRVPELWHLFITNMGDFSESYHEVQWILEQDECDAGSAMTVLCTLLPNLNFERDFANYSFSLVDTILKRAAEKKIQKFQMPSRKIWKF